MPMSGRDFGFKAAITKRGIITRTES